MPRDLFSSEPKDDSLVASPESQTPKPEGTENTITAENDGYPEFSIHRDEATEPGMRSLFGSRNVAEQQNDLHPYVQTLSISNLESCVALENAVFPEQERCSREKLCFGLFSTVSGPKPPASQSTYSAAHSPDSSSPSHKAILVAMIIAAKTTAPSVTDESMEYPPEYQIKSPSADEVRGHLEHGRTIGIHSLGVLPAYQKKGLAKTIMKSYQQRMETSGIADRIALLAHEHLLKMYEGMGFVNKGKSEVKFGGGGWTNLIYEFSEHGPGMMFGS